MDLAEWMNKTATTPSQLAALMGVPLVTVYHWRAKRKFPRVGQLREIERITGGEVTPADLLPNAPKREHPEERASRSSETAASISTPTPEAA